MDINTNQIRELLDSRDAIDAELQQLLTGTKERKPQTCGKCGEAGHSARTCTKKGDNPQQS